MYNGVHRFAVEAKRPRYGKRVRANVEFAAKQIEEHGYDGLIFVDFSLLLNEMDKLLLPQAKDPRWHMETPDKVPGFHSLLGQYMVAECRSASTQIAPPERAARVLGISAFASTAVVIGGAAFARPPLPCVVQCRTLVALQPGGERLKSDFESREGTARAREDAQRQVWWREPA